MGGQIRKSGRALQLRVFYDDVSVRSRDGAHSLSEVVSVAVEAEYMHDEESSTE